MLKHVRAITAAAGNAERSAACLEAAETVSAYDDPAVAATLILAAAGFAQAAATDKLRKAHGEAQERVRSALVSLGPV